jgi:two-component system chemotaxis response regulator CheY
MRKKIIVVDDSSTARQQIRAALVGSEYEIIEAVDGNDGLAKITDHNDAVLVICDVNMPNKNGLEMLDAMHRQGPAMKVVMLTAEVQPELLQQAKRSGAKGWIVKPFKPELFVATVRKLVGDA